MRTFNGLARDRVATSSFSLESMLFEAIVASMNNDFPVLGCPIHKGNGKISHSPVVYQGEVLSLSSLHRYDKYIYHAGYISQEGSYFHTIPSYE
jgi:hypothetical protein